MEKADNNAPKEVQLTPGRSKIIAVTSGKGGVGKTNVSVNLALAMGAKGQRVLLFDADMGLANVDVMLGLMPTYNLLHVLNGQKELHEILTDGPEGIKIIAAGSGGVQELADLSETQRARFLDALVRMRNDVDVILIDTGAGLQRNVLAFALSADEVVVVTTPEPTALMDAYGMIKILNRERKNPLVRVVVNMAGSQNEADEAGKKLVVLSKRFLNLDVDYRGFIPRDMGMVRAVKEQRPILLSSPMNPAALQLSRLADGLLTSGPVEGDGSLLNFFKKVTRIFGAKEA
ncbi:MAG TPA: MinD/ParA family protein [bacterium]|nr:MinD/ParA family protein [bacterium]